MAPGTPSNPFLNNKAPQRIVAIGCRGSANYNKRVGHPLDQACPWLRRQGNDLDVVADGFLDTGGEPECRHGPNCRRASAPRMLHDQTDVRGGLPMDVMRS